jgi:ABC-2 type transport system ATP-binding protein
MREKLRDVLVTRGATVRLHGQDGLIVTGMDADAVGDLATHHGISLRELTTQQASLEDAFMQLTHDSVDFRPGQVA